MTVSGGDALDLTSADNQMCTQDFKVRHYSVHRGKISRRWHADELLCCCGSLIYGNQQKAYLWLRALR